MQRAISARYVTLSSQVKLRGAETGKEKRRLIGLLLLPAAFLLHSCSDKALSVFFDLPKPAEAEVATESTPSTQQPASPANQPVFNQPTTFLPTENITERPEIESVTAWDEAEAMLPKDDIDEIDWVEAMRQGIIRPRATGDRLARGDPVFSLDFYLKGPDETYDAYFPHSVHTRLLDCRSCHTKIFRYRDNELTMDANFEGLYCGTCHGKVAFSLNSCARCHTGME